MPDSISLPSHVASRGHPEIYWIPASAGMTAARGFVVSCNYIPLYMCRFKLVKHISRRPLCTIKPMKVHKDGNVTRDQDDVEPVFFDGLLENRWSYL
jgi:hypothetical protein